MVKKSTTKPNILAKGSFNLLNTLANPYIEAFGKKEPSRYIPKKEAEKYNEFWGNPKGKEKDHVLAYSRNGPNIASNLQPLTSKQNKKKSNK
jgi:hypothetical protein